MQMSFPRSQYRDAVRQADWDKVDVPERVRRMEDACRRAGLPLGRKRQAIIQVLAEMEDHPDSHEIKRRAERLDPMISTATIYRTLTLFEQAGIVQRRDFRDGRAHYEVAHKTQHHHLIDLSSGKVIDFRREDFDALLRRVANEMGYELVDYRLDLYGAPGA